MNANLTKVLMLTMTSVLSLSVIAAKIEITQDHKDALYHVGEETTFFVTVKNDEGRRLSSGSVTWTLDNFGTIKLGSGKTDLSTGNPFKIKGKMSKEGFLRLTVKAQTNSVTWGVGYDVDKIRQEHPCPKDFDEYWTSEKARLEREVPLDAKCVLDESLSDRRFDCYRVSFATFNNKRVYGFMAVPKKSAFNPPYRVRVSVPGAGPGAILQRTFTNEICLTMNVHCFEPEKTVEAQKRHINEQNEALAKKYELPKAHYSVAGIAESREDYWFHDVMLGINRAVDWVCARRDVDRKHITYRGSSQGGGFGLFLNYLNSHFTKSFVAVCAITGHFGSEQDRANGWPGLIVSQQPQKRQIAARNAPYFDGINFAARIQCPIRFMVGFADQTCPPVNVYAAYNVCPAKDKAIINAIGSEHNWMPTYHKMLKENACIDVDAWLRSK